MIDGLIFLQVQLSTTHNLSLPVPPTAAFSAPAAQAASKILALIEAEEGKYQSSLNDAYQDMGEKTFKSLRRALPLTRQKLDWDKVRCLNCVYCVRVHQLMLLNWVRCLGTNLERS